MDIHCYPESSRIRIFGYPGPRISNIQYISRMDLDFGFWWVPWVHSELGFQGFHISMDILDIQYGFEVGLALLAVLMPKFWLFELRTSIMNFDPGKKVRILNTRRI